MREQQHQNKSKGRQQRRQNPQYESEGNDRRAEANSWDSEISAEQRGETSEYQGSPEQGYRGSQGYQGENRGYGEGGNRFWNPNGDRNPDRYWGGDEGRGRDFSGSYGGVSRNPNGYDGQGRYGGQRYGSSQYNNPGGPRYGAEHNPGNGGPRYESSQFNTPSYGGGRSGGAEYNNPSYGSRERGAEYDNPYFSTPSYGGFESGSFGVSERYGSYSQQGRAPKGYSRSDERIREDVCDRLVQANLDAGEMEIEVSEGEVELKGTAPSREIKHAAERIAASVLGVKDVNNHLRIQRETQGSTQGSSSSGSGSSSTGR